MSNNHQNISTQIKTQTDSPSLDIRESMKVFPEFTQPFLTWLTAKPYQGQKPWQRNSLYHLATALAYLFLGIALSIFVVKKIGY